MKKVVSLKRKISIASLLMVGILFLSSVFTMLIDTTKAAANKPVARAGYELRDADMKYDNEGKLKASVIQSSKSIDKDARVLVVIEVDDNSLGDNYLTYANAKYENLSEYVNSDAGKSYALNMTSRQNALYDRLSQKFDMEFKYSYSAFFNGFSAYVRYGDIEEIEKDDKVHNVVISESYETPQLFAASSGDVASNIVKIHETGIYDTSSSVYNGENMLVAVLDTGLDHQHKAFANEGEYRGVNGDGKYSKQDIADRLATEEFRSEESTKGLTANDVYISEKIPYAYDYADKDAEVFPVSYHGTHVAGIIAGWDDTIKGAAVSAQLAIMKVFSDRQGGGENADIWAAVDDCVYLGVDLINMSLGAPSGFSRDKDYYWSNIVYDKVLAAGINLIVAVGNEYSSGFASTHGLNLTSNPDSATASSPSSYAAAISVASIEGVKEPYLLAYDGKTNKNGPVNGLSIYYTSPSDNNGEELKFMDRLLGDEQRQEFDYVVVPGIGQSSDYASVDVKGKIAVVKRGVDTFIDKIKVAAALGAKGVIIRNNVAGKITMSLGKEDLIPSCSITMEDGDELFNRSKAKGAAGQGNGGKIILDKSYLAGPFMSTFSSWGPLPDLELKPEITAHGGNITSADIGNSYKSASGTSMAAPNFAGIATLLRQHVTKPENAARYGIDPNDTIAVARLVNQLFMSTATIAINEKSDPYSPRKQGAGLADLQKAENTSAYLYVEKDGVEYDKTKITLGDDPNKTGIYDLDFFVKNIADRSYSYKLNTIVLTEGVSTDGKTVTEVPVLLTDSSISVSVTGGTYNKSSKTVTVNGNSSAKISVKVKLSKSEKKYLDANFKNGMFVEGFVQLTPTSVGSTSVTLNIPYLTFYGNWADAPILDKTIYETSPDEVNDDLQDHEKNKPDVRAVLPYGKATRDQGYSIEEYFFPLGQMIYQVADQFDEVAVEEDKSALSLDEDGVYGLWAVCGFLRNACTVNVKITNAYTGQIMLQKPYQHARKSSVSSAGVVQFDYGISDDIDINNFVSESGVRFVEGGKYTFEMEAFLDWGEGEERGVTYGNKNKFSFSFYVDSVAPEIVDVGVRLEKDRNFENPRRYIDFEIYDGHYTSAMDLQYYDPNLKTYTSIFGSGLMPLYATRGGTTSTVIDVTHIWDYIVANDYEVLVMAVDYAWNQTYQYLNIKDSYNDVLEMSFSSEYAITPLQMRTNEEFNLFRILNITARDNDRLAWDEDFDWSIDENFKNILDVHEGKVVAINNTDITGAITVTVTSKANPNVKASIQIEVSSELYNNKSAVYPSAITLNRTSITLSTGTVYEMTATLSPHYVTGDYSIVWSSNRYDVNKDVVGSDGLTHYERTNDGYVKVEPTNAQGTTAKITVGGIYKEKLEGYARPIITATVIWDGKPQNVSASCLITIPETFEVSYHSLTKYNGNAEVVVIPDYDVLGIENIGPSAFSGNQFIKEVTVPEGVREIGNYAFVYCPNLEVVNLPNSLITIGEWAFAGKIGKDSAPTSADRPTAVSSLREVNFPELKEGEERKLRNIGIRAFAQCESLEYIDLSTVTGIAKLAFYNNYKLTNLDLSSCKTISDGAFYACSGIKTIEFCDGVEIGEHSFYGNSSLGVLEIPAARIGMSAFSECSKQNLSTGEYLGLERVKFTGSSPLIIGDYAFLYCYGLTKIDFGDVEVKSIGNYAFAIAYFVTELTLPGSLESIGEGAFQGLIALEQLKIHKDLNFIKVNSDFTTVDSNMLFYGCEAISSIIVVDDDGNEIDSEFFHIENNIIYGKKANGDPDYTRIYFVPFSAQVTASMFEGIKYIAPNAFSGNQSLPETINLTGVEEIGDNAFYRSNVKNVIYSSSLVSVGNSAFENCTNLVSFVYSDSSEGAKNNLSSIGARAFQSTAIATINLPSGITEIKDYTFYDCSRLQKVVTENATITSIGNYAFTNSTIDSINLSNATYIGEAAFMLCHKLKTITNLDKAETIGNYAFSKCYELSVATLNNVTHIGDYAFGQCNRMTAVDLPKVTHIGNYAFSGEFFNPIYFELLKGQEDNRGNLQKLEHSLDMSTACLASVTMPKVVFIGEGAFRYSLLTTVTIPNTIENILTFAFSNCDLIEEFIVDENENYFNDEFGVLYGHMPKLYPVFAANGTMSGYSEGSLVLIAYPIARTADSVGAISYTGVEYTYRYYEVLVGTTKIEAGAFIGSDLEYIEFPFELNIIGHNAFLNCNSLRRIDFHSYYAPALETVIRSEQIISWTKQPDVYSYADFNKVTAEYGNFVFTIDGTDRVLNIDTYRPSNGVGYEDKLYMQFFANVIATAENVITPVTESFINSIRGLADIDNMDWYRDNETVNALNNTRYLLTSEQLRYVSSDLLTKLTNAKIWIDNNEPVPSNNKPPFPWLVVIIVSAAVVLVAGGAVAFIFIRKKSKANAK